MRILMTTDAVGGVWTFTQQLAKTLLAQDHSVAVVNVGPLPSDSQRDWCVETSATNTGGNFLFKACDCALEWTDDNGGAYRDAEELLLRTAKEFVPDVFVSGQFCFGKLPLDIPKVVVAHSDVLSWAQACRGGALPWSKWLEQYVELVSTGIEGADVIVAPTLWMHSALAANFTLPHRTVVIPNGRNIAHSNNGVVRRHQAISAGRLWDEAKNLRLLEQLPPGVPIKVAGAFADVDYRPVSGRVEFCGKLPEAELLNLFRSSNIYLCTSRYEPFGLAPLEAALCGCAVVANDIPSLREVWSDGAIFFHGVDELARVLDELNDPERMRAAQLRSAARGALFSAERMTERYLNLFERLVRLQHSTRSAVHAA